jgi:hypothetical protein
MVDIDYPDSDMEDIIIEGTGNVIVEAAPQQEFFSVLENTPADAQLADSMSAMQIDGPVRTWEEYHITAIAAPNFPAVSEFRKTYRQMLEMVYDILTKRFPVTEFWYDRVGLRNVRVHRARTRQGNWVCGVVLVEKVQVMWSREQGKVRADGNPCYL